ncbi:hypothetical protein K474DRAFT_1678790 [Panus rudis PR-1116 ss-1]|nr:hypothetical protein K474DRAFT_1678790 [Panus rudis PR-1116 ss-1]
MPREDFPPYALQEALAMSAVTGEFTNTAYHLFSRRFRSGRVGKPRAVYVNSKVITAAGQHFRKQFLDASSKSEEVPHEVDADEYGYYSDSDLEDDYDVVPGGTSPPFRSSSNEEEVEAAKEAKLEAIRSKIKTKDRKANYNVVITDIAANTWDALVFYILTGRMNFAPLRSEGIESRMVELSQFRHDNPYLPLPCSPKSVYRLADKVGLDGLKDDSLKKIRDSIGPNTIVDELFSKFSSRYPEVLQIEMDYFCTHAIKNPAVMSKVQQRIQSVVKGDLPHAAPVLMAILQRIPDCHLPESPRIPLLKSNNASTGTSHNGSSQSKPKETTVPANSRNHLPANDVARTSGSPAFGQSGSTSGSLPNTTSVTSAPTCKASPVASTTPSTSSAPVTTTSSSFSFGAPSQSTATAFPRGIFGIPKSEDNTTTPTSTFGSTTRPFGTWSQGAGAMPGRATKETSSEDTKGTSGQGRFRF